MAWDRAKTTKQENLENEFKARIGQKPGCGRAYGAYEERWKAIPSSGVKGNN